MWRNVLAFCTVLVLFASTIGTSTADNWPAWRGPLGTGVSSEADLPTKWSSTENVRWKVPLDQPGNSTPVVWGDRIFLTQQESVENEGGEPADDKNAEERKAPTERTVLCFDRADGNLLWQKGVTYTEKEATHRTNPYCSSSPATDGERVIAWFGSAGLVCYDMDGNKLWFRDLGRQAHMWGYGASPVLHNDLCILNFGPGERSFVVAVNKHTGETIWNADIPKPAEGEDTGPVGPENASKENQERSKSLRGSWSTPLIIKADGREELVVSMPNRIRAFDPPTGNVLWTCDGLGRLSYASAMWGDGVLVSFGGYHSASIAVRPGGTGQVKDSHLIWRTPRSKSSIGTGVIANGHLFMCAGGGILECRDLQTNKTVWKKRLRAPGSQTGDSWSSLLLSGDKIYSINKSGDTFVFRAAPKFELIETNQLSEETNSSLAPSDGEIFIRTHQHLWCIGKKSDVSLKRPPVAVRSR